MVYRRTVRKSTGVLAPVAGTAGGAAVTAPVIQGVSARQECRDCGGPVPTMRGVIAYPGAPIVCRECFGQRHYSGRIGASFADAMVAAQFPGASALQGEGTP